LKYGLVNTKQQHPATKLYLISIRVPTQAMDRHLNFNTEYFKTECERIIDSIYDTNNNNEDIL